MQNILLMFEKEGYQLLGVCVRVCFSIASLWYSLNQAGSGFSVLGHGGNCLSNSCISGGNSKSTSTKYPVSASSGVRSMVFRNVSDRTVCNAAGFDSELVRNVSDSGSGMVPDVGHGTNFMSLYGTGWTIAHPYRLLAST